jgi:hypothetical protein
MTSISSQHFTDCIADGNRLVFGNFMMLKMHAKTKKYIYSLMTTTYAIIVNMSTDA